MLFSTTNKNSILEDMQYLPAEESANSELDKLGMLKVFERPHSDEYMVSLEDAIQFTNDFGSSINETISKIARFNRISESDIVFSVHPSSVIVDEEVGAVCNNLLQEGTPVYFNINSSPMYTEFGKVLEEAVMNDCSDEIDEFINEGVLDRFIGAAKQGVSKGTGQAVKDFGQGVVSVGANALRNAVGSGIERGAKGVVQRRLDNVINTSKIQDMAKAHGVNGEGLDMIGDIVNGFKDDLAKTGGNIMTGGGGAVLDKLKGMLDQVTSKISFFGRKLASGEIDQNKRSMLQKGLDALKRLKDAIVSRIRGIKK